MQVNKVWINKNIPIERGWFKKNIIKENIIINNEKNILITKNSLIKIIILEIIDKENLFLWSF